MATINTDIAQKINIIARENNSATINLVITNSDGTAFNLTGYTITHIVYDTNITYIAKTGSNGITALGGGDFDTTGKIVISFSPSDFNIIPSTYKHKLTLSKGSYTQTWMYGNFKLNED